MMIMKKLYLTFKTKFPYYKERILASIDILLVYQGLLFLISPNVINQLLLIALVVIFILLMVKKI